MARRVTLFVVVMSLVSTLLHAQIRSQVAEGTMLSAPPSARITDRMAAIVSHPEACSAITLACGQTRTNPITTGGCLGTDGFYYNGYLIKGTARKPFRFDITSPSIAPELLFSDSVPQLLGSALGEPTRHAATLAGSFPFTGNFYLFVQDVAPYVTGNLSVAYSCTSGGSTPGGNLLALQGERFRVTITARDQRTGATAPGVAIPQNDQFGYFSLPGLTGDASNPEVFVKVVDGRPINGHFWVFYGGLTDLGLSVSVQDAVSGHLKTYEKQPGDACGGFDVAEF